jgi:hypothetical protein
MALRQVSRVQPLETVSSSKQTLNLTSGQKEIDFMRQRNCGNERLGENFKGVGTRCRDLPATFYDCPSARFALLFTMGRTLPAAMKFAQRDDPRRSIMAFF